MGPPAAPKDRAAGGRLSAPVDHRERWPLAKLKPYAKNPNLHSEEQIGLIAASLARYGQTQLIVVDGDAGETFGEILAGHGRYAGATRLGWTEVDVGLAIGWPVAEKHAYRIIDNQLTRLSEWSGELLAAEVNELDASGYDLALLGLDDSLLNDATATPEVPTPEPPKDPVVRSGDLWTLGDHRLLCGDATKAEDVARVLGDAKPHIMITDPPYGVDYDPNWRNEADRANGKPYGASAIGQVKNDNRSDWTEAYKLFTGDVAYVWHPAGAKQVDFFTSLVAAGFEIRMQIIWAKSNFPIGRGNYHVKHEPCWYAVRKGKTAHWSGDRTQNTLWEIAKPSKSETGHSTQKPIECMKRPIENNSKRGDYVYEPFSGSFTTGIACEMTGRKCLAIEIAPEYVEVGIMRWQEQTGKQEEDEIDQSAKYCVGFPASFSFRSFSPAAFAIAGIDTAAQPVTAKTSADVHPVLRVSNPATISVLLLPFVAFAGLAFFVFAVFAFVVMAVVSVGWGFFAACEAFSFAIRSSVLRFLAAAFSASMAAAAAS
jgi:DNA modification methylase